MMSAVSAASSSGPVGDFLWVERGWPRTMQARRSDTPSPSCIVSTHARRRAGLRSFPVLLPSESACRASDRRQRVEDECSPPRVPSAASPGRPSSHRTPSAIGNTSLPSPRSFLSLRSQAGLGPSTHPPAEALQRSPQPCAASLPSQSSIGFKNYTSGRTTSLGAGHFVPVGTLNYWQGWAYLGTFVLASGLYT